MQPRFTFMLATLGLAAALVAAPVGVQDNAGSLCGKTAFAAGNGKGGGNGRGGGRGHGRGNSGAQGLSNNVSASADAPGKSGSAPGHGGTGHGQSVGHDAVSGVSAHAAHQNGNSFKGNVNASHASAQAFAHAANNSMVGAIREAIHQSYVSNGDDDTVIGREEIDLGDLEDALMGISNKDVDADVADAVAGEVDGKVSEPAGP